MTNSQHKLTVETYSTSDGRETGWCVKDGDDTLADFYGTEEEQKENAHLFATARAASRLDESAWFIELSNNDGTVLAPAHYFGLDERGWTTDHQAAIRFCRKEDAERAIQLLRGFIYTGTNEKAISTEHQWDVGPRKNR
jgi:hypothetical protein